MLKINGTYKVQLPSVELRLAPTIHSKTDDQVLYGESVKVLELADGFAKVQVACDEKVLWLPAASKVLRDCSADPLPNYRVSATRAVVFSEPDAESPHQTILPITAKLSIQSQDATGDFGKILGMPYDGDCWVRMSALAPANGSYANDFVAVMEQFVGMPYIWGYRDGLRGFDCSGLLLLALFATGWVNCPRDTKDMVQHPAFGEFLDYPSFGYGPERGDIVFFPGHVVVMVDGRRCIHCTDIKPHHRVLIQNLSQVIGERTRSGNGKGAVTAVRRFPMYRHQQLRQLAAAR